MVTQIKECFFEHQLRDAVLDRFTVEEELSVNVWKHYQSSIEGNLGSYWFVALIPF